MRLDENGDSLWSKSIPGGLGSSVSLTEDGGYIIAGATGYTTAGKNDGFLARLGPDLATGIEVENSSIPQDNCLFQNYPNPFNPLTNIRFFLCKSENVELIVYDALGRRVSTLVNEKLAAGSYEVTWDAGDNPSGVYLYQLIADDFNQVEKMLLVK
jgi:hypothetical protein